MPALGINMSSLQQTITPDALRGRMNATMQFLVMGTLPFGGVLGRVLCPLLGVCGTLCVVVFGLPCRSLIIICWSLRALREQPALMEIEQPVAVMLEPA